MKFHLGSGAALLAVWSGFASASDTVAAPTAPASDDQFTAAAEDPPQKSGSSPGSDAIIVTATRVPTPITAIPNTVRVLDRETVATQLAVSPSLIDSLSFSIPSLAPGRQRMTSTG